jgi:hypothetical protein
MTGFAAPARGRHQRLLKTPQTKIAERRTKSKQLFSPIVRRYQNAVRFVVSQKTDATKPNPMIPSATYRRVGHTTTPTARGTGALRIMAKRGSEKKTGPVESSVSVHQAKRAAPTR